MSDELHIYCNSILIGTLNLIDKKQLEFQYSESWLNNNEAFPLSIQLPVNNKVYKDEQVRPFFENLLPESIIRQTLARQFHISETNVFGMLEKIGGDCAGAISLYPPDFLPSKSKKSYQEMNENEVEKIVRDLPSHPFLANRKLRLSLAGAQNKLPIYLKNNKIYLPVDGLPSSHILKPPIQRFQHSVINEFFSMKIAEALGLSIPPITLRKNSTCLYIIERFDRTLNTAGELIRIHQEDFCQAMGLLSNQKYESEGGPTLAQCFTLIKTNSSQPAVDVINLLNWVVCNYLIGNADAHAKNLSFIITESGARLSPFYDILCTHIYPELDSRYAMKIGGENRPQWIKKRHWERCAENIQVKPAFIYSVIEKIIEKYFTMLPNFLGFFPHSLDEAEQKFIAGIVDLTKKRANDLIACLSSAKN